MIVNIHVTTISIISFTQAISSFSIASTGNTWSVVRAKSYEKEFANNPSYVEM